MVVNRATSELYLDANATTPVLPEAAQEAHDAMEALFGNPSSSHVSGLRARHILESARDLVREVLGASDGKIVFTSSATEAIQMGIFSTLCDIRELRAKGQLSADNRTLLYGATEHKAVPQALEHWNRLLGVNNRLLQIPVDTAGILDVEFIRKHASNADLICTMAVNNETGAITDLEMVEKTIRGESETVRWLVDSVQSLGKIELNLSKTTIDYAAVSGHKIYAPKGIGLLYIREGAPLVPLLAGGGQENGARGGTENLPGVAAIAAVMKILVGSKSRTFTDEQVLRGFQDRLVASLKSAFPTIVFNTPFDNAVSTTVNFSVKGFPSKELLDLFDAAGMRVSSGSACGSSAQRSYVLDAMGLPAWRSSGAIRLSFGPLSTASDIAAACERIEQAGQALCDSCLVVSSDADSLSSRVLDGLVQLKCGSMCTWLLMNSNTKRCLVIDPCEELAERVESLVRCQHSKVTAILDTHAHVDHDSFRKPLLKLLSSHAAPSAHTSDQLGWPDLPDGTVTLSDGSQAPYLKFSDKWVIVQADLPGHSLLSRAFLVGPISSDQTFRSEDVVFAFTGDTILIGGIGRTDFPCSSIEKMFESLHRLPKLISDQAVICPTHDYNNDFSTTLAFERNENPFLARILCHQNPLGFDQFAKAKSSIDQGIVDATSAELVVGLIKNGNHAGKVSIEIRKDELVQFFREHHESLVIDVREPHEFAFAQDWEELGFTAPPKNIPLTRLTGYLPSLRALQKQSPRDVIFLCRSGKRSGKATEVACRLGIKTAKHIAGGIALNSKRACPVPVDAHKMDADEMGFVI